MKGLTCWRSQWALLILVALPAAVPRRPCPSNSYIEYGHTSPDRGHPEEQQRLPFLSQHLDEPFSANMSLPWECGYELTWRDLGEGYFPRYIREVVCTNGTCWYGHYSCQPIIVEMKVLALNTENCRDTGIPQSIRRNWMFAKVRVGAYCGCSR